MLIWTLLSVGLAQSPGDYRWLVSETALKRFVDAEQISATVKASTKVEVIALGDNLVRVRAGRDMGWVSVDQLTETKPAGN